MNKITRESMNNTVTDFTENTELVEYRQDGENIYVTILALEEQQADIAMEAMEEAYSLRIKTIKHEDGYVRIHYVQTNTIAKEEVKMNTINFVAAEDGIIVIDSTPTKRIANVRIKALLPAVSLSTMRERKAKHEIAKREAEVKAQLGFKPTSKADQQIKESQVPNKTTPSIQAELDMLKHIIASMSPEARAEATRLGIIRGAQAQFNRETNSIKHVGVDRTKVKGEVKSTTRANAIGKRQRAEVVKRECACGCGTLTGGNFAMGHDARSKGRFLRMLRGTQIVAEINWTPSEAEIAYAIANPQWSAEIYEYVMGL